MKLSIIIPTFNVEKFISKTLDSILEQSFQDLEIIVVDDHSEDNTRDILNAMARKFPKIKLFLLDRNHGVSFARNYGIEKATGDYLFFMDGDDYLSEDALEKLFLKLNNQNDAVLINYAVVDSNGNNISLTRIRFSGEHFPNNAISGYEAAKLLFKGKISHWSCEVIIKRNIVLENNICFPVGRSYGEDFATIYRFLFVSKKVDFIKDKIYYYVQRSDSAMHNHRETDSKDYYDTIFEIDNYVGEKYPELRQLANIYELPRLINAYCIQCKYPFTHSKKLLKKIKRLIFEKLSDKVVFNSLKSRDKIKVVVMRVHLLQFVYFLNYLKDKKLR